MSHFQEASVRKRVFMMKCPQLPAMKCHSEIMNSHKSPLMVRDIFSVPIVIRLPLHQCWMKTLVWISLIHSLLITASTIHEHKSNVTSVEETLTLPITQTAHASDDGKQHDVIPDFKKISTNFTSFIDDLLHGNDVAEAMKPTTKLSTTLEPQTSTSKPVKSIINDDDFIIKHLKAPTAAVKTTPGTTEIFSKPTSNVAMNGLLKLAGCNIYGQMYEVGNKIAELSNACLECKCLPDIGVGCFPKC